MNDFGQDSGVDPTRRRLLAALAGGGLASLAGCFDAGEGTGTAPAASEGSSPSESSTPEPAGDPAYHPGPPRFAGFAEAPDPPEMTGVSGNLAPWNPDPDAAYEWSVHDQPDNSSESLDGDVVQFQPPFDGEYTLRLDGPGAPADLTVRAFESSAGLGPRPRVTLRPRVDGDRVVVEADASAPPSGDVPDDELAVEFHVDDRDELTGDALTVEGHTASVPASALDGETRVHAVAVGDTYSAADHVRIDPDGPTVARPNDPPEWLEDAVIYEIFVRSFDEDVTFDRLTERLPYVDDLGADVVWLTPILAAHSHRNPTVPGGPHGYDVVDYFETASALGSLDDFERFVDACHERDIRVLFDLVVNHSAREHPFFQEAVTDTGSEYRDWYVWRDDGEPVYYNGWSGIPIFNFDSLAVREHLLEVVDFWAERVDGFRCDVAWGVPHSFWKEVRARVKADHPEFALLDEAFPSTADYHEAEFDLHYGDALFEGLRKAGRYGDAGYVQDALVERLDRGFPEHAPLMNYVENHDVDRYLDDVGSRTTQQAAALATFTLPGAPLVYYGQERGLSGMRATMNWSDGDEALLSFYRDLVALRQSAPALRTRAALTDVDAEPDSDAAMAYGRTADDQRLVVVCNFGERPATVRLPEGVGATDLVTDSEVSAPDDERSVRVDWGAVLERT